jgi:starvation-inducible DNA-binding protein
MENDESPLHPKIIDPVEIEIALEDRRLIADGLSRLLSDSFVLYLRSLNFHWNVTGQRFLGLRSLFGMQSLEISNALDMIAERIRAIGFPAPATLKEFETLSSLKDSNENLTAEQMIESLAVGQEVIVATILGILPVVHQFRDLPTEELLTRRTFVHQKNHWMLRSLLS